MAQGAARRWVALWSRASRGAGLAARTRSGAWARRLAAGTQATARRVRGVLGRLPAPASGGQAGAIVRAAPAALRQVLAALARPFGLRGWRAGAALTSTVLGLLIIVAAALGGPGARLQPGPALPEVIGFYQNGWSQMFRSSFPSLRAHYRYINTVLAFWYSVDGNGRLHAHAPQPAVTAWVRSHHMRMGVLINNIAGTSGDNAGMLRTATLRRGSAAAIAALVARNGYQEVNVDFELLPPGVRGDFTRFIADLRRVLPRTVVLSASVFPKLGVPSSLNGAYDYVALARYVSYLVIMLYDRHSSGGPAGPVSPYPWVVSNIKWFLHTAGIPGNRLVLAAGVYGYDWPAGSTSANELPLNAIVALAKRKHARIVIDRASGNPFFRYTTSAGTPHIVWFQNNRTVAQRLRLARSLHLRGIAIWALGQETPAVWSVIEQTVAARG